MPTTYAIPDGRTVMAATTYTGAGGTQSVTNTVNGVSFQPDFVWGKARSAAYGSALFDSVRGFGSAKGLVSNLTQAEGTVSAQYGYVSTNTSTGFTATGGTDGSNPNAALNESGVTYVAWQWKAGGTAVSNTIGSNTTAMVSANTTAGFSVVTYTGNYNGSTGTGTVGHGLGVAPSMIIIKNRNLSIDWAVGHTSIGWSQGLNLNLTNSAGASAYFNSTAPTSSVFSVGLSNNTNQNGSSMVAYCFAAVAGYSAFGSYTGNSDPNGTFVYLGFRPRFVMVKGLGSGGSGWQMQDSSRNTYNPEDAVLRADLSNQETTAYGNVMDFLSNGFKLRVTDTNYNSSSTTYGPYIYMAFAENPLKYANAR
jgi:hypothetical protein